ncbi:MAG TPA: thioredoxin family protein [Edaphocola sp.]|nr:thioredoxin family protein [Edaphocola sp.]
MFLCNLWVGLVFGQKAPEINKSKFSKAALSQMVYKVNGDSLSVKKVLKQHRGTVVVLDLWAVWCKDCLAVMEDNHKLKERFPDVKFIYLSLDRSDTAWYKALEKYHLTNEENYWFKSGWKNSFNNYIDLNWIPRYLVLNKKGAISGYYFVHPKDETFIALLNRLTKK